MPFSRTLRIRSSRQRSQKASQCACITSPLPVSTGGPDCCGTSADGTRHQGTTLGYVKCTWSELVARCDRSKLNGDGSVTDHDENCPETENHLRRRGSSDAIMGKRRSVQRLSNNNGPSSNQFKLNGSVRSPSSLTNTQWMTPTVVLKATVLVIIAAVGPAIVLKDFNLRGSATNSFHSSLKDNGGWRLADADTAAKFDSDYCNIERISVTDLDTSRFEKEFRYKKPVIVTFPNGLKDWTDPEKWSLEALRRSYGSWQVSSGNSVEIVRRGGNGYIGFSFADFVDRILKNQVVADQPMYYVFDRDFFRDSKLSATLKLPSYFSRDETLYDSFFFLGASRSGVVFHKHADTWNAVVFGRKRWFLYPSTTTPPGGVHHGYAILDWYERVYPNVKAQQRPLECVQQGGEILYLPEGFYHATLNTGDTLAVAHQRKRASLAAEKLFYEVTDLNKQLHDPTINHQDIHQKLLSRLLELRKLLPENTEVMLKLAEKYGDLGQHQRTVELLQQAVELDPFFVLAYTSLGASLAKLGREEEAEAALTHAITLSPSVWDVYKEYGLFLMQKGRYAEAVPVLTKGTEVNPTLLPFWINLKVAQENSGDLEGAKQTELKIAKLEQSPQI